MCRVILPSQRKNTKTIRTIIFEGSKALWRHNMSIDIIMVEHGNYNIIEIICYSPELLQESRLYIDYKLLITRATAKVQESLDRKKEQLSRQNTMNQFQKTNVQELRKDTNCDVACDMLISRIDIFSIEPNFIVFLRPYETDYLDPRTAKISFQCNKPKSLQPYPFIHTTDNPLDEEQSAKLTIRGILSQNGKISEVVTATTPHSTSDAKSSVSSRKTLVSLIDKETKRAREDAMIKAVISAFRSGLLTIVEDEMEVLTNWSKAKLRWIKAIRKVLYKRQVQQLRLILSVKYPNLSINEIYNPIKTAESIPSGGVINDTDEEPKICSARQILLEDIGQRVELPTLIENETTNSSFPMKKHHFHRKLKKAKSSKGLLKKSPPTDCTHLVDNSRNTSELTAILPSFCTVGELLDFTPRDCACSRNRVLARHRNDNQHENERTQANEHQHMYEQEHEHQNDYQRAGFLSLTTNTSFSNFDDETHTTEACSNMSSTVSINTSANNRIVLPKLIIRHD